MITMRGDPMSSVTLDTGSPQRSAPPRRSTPTLAERRAAARQRLGTDDPGNHQLASNLIGKWLSRHSGPVIAPANGPAPASFYVIAMIVLAFVMLGLVMVLSSTAATAVGGDGSPYVAFARQSMWAALGGVALFAAMRVPYEFWRPLGTPMLLLATVAMMLPFIPGLGANINDTRAWVHIGGLSFQPSEIMKLASLVVVARLYADSKDIGRDFKMSMAPVLVIALLGSTLALAQGDFGSAVVMAGVVVSVAFLAGVPVRYLSAMILSGSALLTVFVITSPRRVARFTSFLDMESNREHTAYQTYQGFLSMANGGLTGSGIGGSNGKLGYLPLAHSDFIFAIIADELGFVGSLAVIGGFALLVWFGIQVALAAPDRFGMLLAGGISAWIGIQTLVNLGGVTGLMPVTGLTLPFFSVGGTSLFVMLTASGILLNIARRMV